MMIEGLEDSTSVEGSTPTQSSEVTVLVREASRTRGFDATRHPNEKIANRYISTYYAWILKVEQVANLVDIRKRSQRV